MIHLFYANRLERLAHALAERIAARSEGPLDPVAIVVPNQATTHYLKVAIADRNGIAANLEFSFLRNFLTQVAGTELFDEERIAAQLVAVLYDDALLAEPDLLPVRRYLGAAGDDDVDRDRRRLGLATQLGRLFDTYALERPERLDEWRRGRPGKTTTERWQRALYLSLPEQRSLVEQFADLEALDVPPVVHLFDVASNSPVLLAILERLARKSALVLYALNPCREYWEDVERIGAAAIERRFSPTEPSPDPDDPFGLLVDTDTPALRYWGRPGRESVRLLDQLTHSDFEGRFDTPTEATTLLDAFKQDVLLRRPEHVVDDTDRREVDDSLVLHACPGVRRELEVIAETIWTLVDRSRDTDRPLRFNEIAVVLASRDREAYRAHIGAVFEEHGDIPHHVLDVPLAASSRVVEAIELLCALPYSRFTRQDLLRLVTHPTVLARHDDANADEWMAWCEALLVVHGADKSDHAGTYIERDLYNWDQGLKRLVLGTFMAGRKSGEMRPFAIGGDHYLPYEIPTTQTNSAARFCVLVRSLIADARFARSERLTIAEWASFLHALVTTYVAATSEAEERDLVRVLGAIHSLAELDVEGLRVTFAAASELLMGRLSGMTTNHGRPLANGVVVAPLSLAYALPFRVVFMPGLGEGRFPAPERASALDLFSEHRRPGQVSPRERDQYWFLLRMLGTSDAVHLSWIATRQETGDKQQPAPTVVELLHLLERNYVGREGAEAIVRQHPLRRWDGIDAARPFASRTAVREAGSRRIRRSLLEHLDPEASALRRTDIELPPLGALRDALAPGPRARLDERLRLVEPPPPRQDDGELRQLSFYALLSFLESPLSGWARVVLRIDDDEREDPFSREDERFGTSAMIRDQALRDVFYESLRAPDVDLEALYHRRADHLELLGDLPTGVFGASERKRHLATLEHWRRELRRARGRGPIDPIRFGRANEHETVRRAEPPILLEVRGQQIELYGSTRALIDEPSTSLVLVGRPEKKRKGDQRLELRGFLDQLVLAAAELHADAHTVHVAFSEEKPRIARFEPFTTEQARDYLSGLVDALLFDHHAYPLTFETVVRVTAARTRGRRREMERILEEAPPSRYGALRDAKVEPLSLERALAIIDERFGPYFTRRQGD